MAQAQAPSSGSATALSPAAKKLRHIINSKLPVPHEDEAINDILKVTKACSKEELAALSLQPPNVPVLDLAKFHEHQPLTTRLEAIQAFISSFQYNHSTGYNYNVGKKRPLPAILTTAAGILVHPLPIKCIEAVFLGILLTQGWTQLQRIPLGFKSRGGDGQVYRHIVLAVCDASSGLYGAVGISRCRQLMDKPLKHPSLAALVGEYQQAYRHVHHELMKVRVGLPVEHDVTWTGPVCWRCCTVNTQRRSWQEAADMLNKHATAAVQLQEQFRVLTTSSSSPSSSNSVPQSPRNVAVVGPHVTRPHSAVRVRCSTPSQPQSDQHLPVLDSPRGRQRNSTWRSPAASQCSSLGSTAHKSPCRSNCSSPHLTKSPPVSKSACSMAAAADEASGFQGAHGRACQEGTRLLHFQGVNSSCDCESSGDANDSDSEVNMLQVLLRK